MAYYLRFDGVDDYVSIPEQTIMSRTQLAIECKFSLLTVPSNFQTILTPLGRLSNDQASITVRTGGNNDSLDFSYRPLLSGGRARVISDSGRSLISQGGVHTLRIERDGNLVSFFLDGQLLGTATTTDVANLTSTTIGSRGDSGAFNAGYYYVKGWDSPNGGNLLFNYDPSASGGTGSILPDTVGDGSTDGTLVNFTVPDCWILYNDGGGAVAYTITLDSGSYSLQGNTLSLLSDRNLSLENGSYSLSGTDLNLAIQRSLVLSEGIYSKQGTNTNLILERLLGLDIGGYTKEGDSLSLLTGRSLPLEGGSYNYLGSNINLQYGREFRLSLEQGTYSYQGSDLNLLKDYILPLESNFYSYTPENVSLLANRKITTESGNYSYVGSPINFIYEAGGITYTLSIDSGDYSLTGNTINLYANRRLPIDFGQYTYEGINSDLLYNRVVALDSGVYSSAGTDLGIKVNRRLVFQNGNYSLQGTPITLSYTGEVLAILEGYRLSYKKHPVRQLKYKPYNITARYN